MMRVVTCLRTRSLPVRDACLLQSQDGFGLKVCQDRNCQVEGYPVGLAEACIEACWLALVEGSGSAQSRSPVTEICIWRGRRATCSPWCCHHGRTTEQSELLCLRVADEMQRPIRQFIDNGDQGLEEINKCC